MWIKLLNTEYFIFYSTNLDICVTDFICIWSVKFSDRYFLKCLKDSNFGLEMNENDLVIKGRHMLENPGGLKKVKVEKDDENILSVSMTMSFGFLLHLDLKLSLGSKELFFQKVTSLLLKTIHDLRTSENELRQILLKKDKEIAEYKDEKGQIVFRSLKTQTFVDTEHMSRHACYADTLGCHDLSPSLLNKTVTLPETLLNHVKEETMKTETLPEKGTEQVVKSEPTNNQTCTVREPVKPEPETTEDIKITNCIKGEAQNCTKSEAQDTVKLEIEQSQHHRVAASPSKRQRKKLNF